MKEKGKKANKYPVCDCTVQKEMQCAVDGAFKNVLYCQDFLPVCKTAVPAIMFWEIKCYSYTYPTICQKRHDPKVVYPGFGDFR